MPPKDSRKQGSKPPNKGGVSKRTEMALNSVAKKASGPGNKQRATTSTTAEDITTPETKTNVESSEGTLPPGNVGIVDSTATPAESPKDITTTAPKDSRKQGTKPPNKGGVSKKGKWL